MPDTCPTCGSRAREERFHRHNTMDTSWHPQGDFPPGRGHTHTGLDVEVCSDSHHDKKEAQA